MRDSSSPPLNRYRLVLKGETIPDAEVAEVCSISSRAALELAGRLYPGRRIEIIENERSLGLIRNSAAGGFWVLDPQRSGNPAELSVFRGWKAQDNKPIR